MPHRNTLINAVHNNNKRICTKYAHKQEKDL